MMKYKKYWIILISIIISISIRFFELKAIDGNIIKYIQLAVFSIVLIYSLRFALNYRLGFSLPIQLILFSMFVSVFVNYFTWEQSITDSLIILLPLTLWCLYFIFLKYKIQPYLLEKIVIYFGVLYLILYFYQLIDYKNVIFGWNEEINITRGVRRIIFPGGGAFYLLGFIALCRFQQKSKYQYFWIFIVVMLLLVPILQVTRQTIFAVLIIFSYHFLKKLNLIYKLLVVLFLSAVIFTSSSTFTKIFSGVTADMNRDLQLGNEYVRVQAASFFLKDLSRYPINYILGNGVARPTKSEYGDKIKNLEDNEGYYIVDVGLIGMYSLFGIGVIIAYIMIWFLSFKIKLPQNYYYLKYYLWFLLLTSFTSDYLYEYNFLVFNVIVIYIYQYLYIIHKTKRIKKTITPLI